MLVQIAGVDKREIDWIKKCPLFWLQLLVPIELLSICIYHLSSLLGAIWRRILELLRRIKFEDLLGRHGQIATNIWDEKLQTLVSPL